MFMKSAIAAAALFAAIPVAGVNAAQHHSLDVARGGYTASAHITAQAPLKTPRVKLAHYRPRKCVAVAKRGGGTGRRIKSTRRVGLAPRMPKACGRAMRKCNDILRWRQNRGKNPYAACVVVRRIRHH